MARDTRDRSTRKDRGLRDGARPVQLRESRRFQTASGNDSANRTATALQNAFGVGLELNQTIVDKRNTEGAEQAAFENAQGGERGDNKTQGYNDMWDSIEASNDLHLFSKELPEVLRGADWENLSEDEAQGVIDGYYQKELKGINPNSTYGKQVAEGIFKQNAQLLDTHRNFQLQRNQQEQRVMIYNEALATFETDGTVDYDTIASRTGVAFDGAEKMSTFWEIIYDLMIDAGDETILNGVPERFPSGDPTGINDPKLLADHNTAIARAVAVREGRERGQAAAAKAERGAMRDQGNLQLLEEVVAGRDPLGMAMDYARNGIIENTDVTVAQTAYRNIRDDKAKQGFDAPRVATLQAQIAVDPTHVSLTPNNLLLDWSNDVFGDPNSPQAKTAFRQMLQDVSSAQERRERVNSDPRKKTWVNRFDESFPIPKDQYGIPVPGPMLELRAEFSAEFEMAILDTPPDKYREVYAAFSQEYSNARKLSEAQVASGNPAATLRQTTRGNFEVSQAAAHARLQGWNVDTFILARKEGKIEFAPNSPEEAAYKELLQALIIQ